MYHFAVAFLLQPSSHVYRHGIFNASQELRLVTLRIP